MELLAVIKGLEALKKDGFDVVVTSDSEYVVNAIEKGWLKSWEQKGWKKVKNVDLWKRFLDVYKKHHVRFKWIKGHSGHPENERCDELAVQVCQLGPLKEDVGYITSLQNVKGMFND